MGKLSHAEILRITAPEITHTNCKAQKIQKSSNMFVNLFGLLIVNESAYLPPYLHS